MDASTKPIRVNRKQAEQAAQIFMRHPHIHGVELFGRTAREGQGNDLDLILVTDKERAETFLDEVTVRLNFDVKCSYNNPVLRFNVSVHTLGGNICDLFRETALASRVLPLYLDLFVFPSDWRERLEELQDALPHKDPHFMENIARDAVKIA